jgi:hypothetical protein
MGRPENSPGSPADWLIGGAPKKRALLECLLREPRPPWTNEPWSESQLCVHIHAQPGGLDEHLGRLVDLGFLRVIAGRPRRWYLVKDEDLGADLVSLRERLSSLFEALDRIT